MLIDLNKLEEEIAQIGEKLNTPICFTMEIHFAPGAGGVLQSQQVGTFWVSGRGTKLSNNIFSLLEDVVSKQGDVKFDLPN